MSRTRRALWICVVLAAACSTPPADVATLRVRATPEPTSPPATPSPSPSPALDPTAKPSSATRRPAPAPAARRVALAAPPLPAADVSAFLGLGAWIDVFDFDDDPNSILPAVRDMAARGVRTLYLETSRHDHGAHITYPNSIGAAVEAAHGAGMKVVAWYPPDFVDLDRDVARSLAAVHYVSPGGHRFDAFGADIERTDVKDPSERNRRMLEYSRRLREGAGAYPMAAIVIPPSSLQRNPGRWPEFPWAAMAAFYEVCMPMNYWTGRSTDPALAYEVTKFNTEETRRLCGKPVHNIGGLGAQTDEPQAAAYVRAVLESGSIGGGLYDYRTTRLEVWDELAVLNR